MSKVDTAYNVADALTPHLRKVTDLVVLPDNPRRGDIGAISRSLERFGQLKPIVVDTDGLILAGNHTFQAAAALGWTHVAAVTADDLTGQEKTAFALADNRLSDLADYDNDLLLAQLQDLATLDGTGYDYDDLDDLIALDQEYVIPEDGVANNPTVAERQAAREAAAAAGMVVRSLVILLTEDQHAWSVNVLDSTGAATNTDAFLAILADYSGQEPPDENR